MVYIGLLIYENTRKYYLNEKQRVNVEFNQEFSFKRARWNHGCRFPLIQCFQFCNTNSTTISNETDYVKMEIITSFFPH